MVRTVREVGIDQQWLGYHGAGFYLSGGIVALGAGSIAAWQFLRRLATPAA
jgi:hypothetical protein